MDTPEVDAAFAFPNTNDVAHHPIELRVEAEGALVKPLKDLYIGLARDAGRLAAAKTVRALMARESARVLTR